MAWTLTVSELNDYVRRALASDPSLRFLSLRGEISDFKRYASGHWYFTLKDEQSRIQCVCYRQNAMRVPFVPEGGMKVVVTGAIYGVRQLSVLCGHHHPGRRGRVVSEI